MRPFFLTAVHRRLPIQTVIRTAGEMRISNFLLWQIAYTEIWVTKRLWPDFTKEDLLEAIADYRNGSSLWQLEPKRSR